MTEDIDGKFGPGVSGCSVTRFSTLSFDLLAAAQCQTGRLQNDRYRREVQHPKVQVSPCITLLYS